MTPSQFCGLGKFVLERRNAPPGVEAGGAWRQKAIETSGRPRECNSAKLGVLASKA